MGGVVSEMGPGGKWAVIRDIKADPGGSMAVVESDAYRSPCMTHNPGVPVYSKKELTIIKQVPQSAELFRAVQRIKKVFPTSRVVRNELPQ